MVKVYTSTYSYDHSFPLVTLAYFLRYPNPYSRHVLTSDVISRHFDAKTGRLYTTRIHLKKSKLPKAITKLLPCSLTGTCASEESRSYILETSLIDIKEGWMKTESQNLNWTGVLSVIERHHFTRCTDPTLENSSSLLNCSSTLPKTPTTTGNFVNPFNSLINTSERTNVSTTVTLNSSLGDNWRKRKVVSFAFNRSSDLDQPHEQKYGFFRTLSTNSLQRTIELIGLNRTKMSQPYAAEGMKIVLERLRSSGPLSVFEGMRHDRHPTSLSLAGPCSLRPSRDDLDT